MEYIWLPAALCWRSHRRFDRVLDFIINNSRFYGSFPLRLFAAAGNAIYADDGETVWRNSRSKNAPDKRAVFRKTSKALLAIEDYRFTATSGRTDRIGGVVIKNITTGKMEGASPITQNLPKIFFLTATDLYAQSRNGRLRANRGLIPKRKILS